MALGSSAPEIMLSVIEIWANDFNAGDLGPGTIVGSAAFNLFMIIGLCIYVIPDDEVRKIKQLLDLPHFVIGDDIHAETDDHEEIEGGRSDNGSGSEVSSFEALGPDLNDREH